VKIISVLDLLRRRNFSLKIENIENENFLVGEKILLNFQNKEKICGEILSPAREISGILADENYVFEKKLSPAEIEKYEQQQKGEKDRIARAQKLAKSVNLKMHFFASRISFDEKTISFFFTSDEQIDFRALLKPVATEFKMRIHFQRVGPRDKARFFPNFGICGRKTCCAKFKHRLKSVPIDLAKDQNLLAKNNEKILGLCGKLKCCLHFEIENYRELRKNLPHIRQTVELKNGKKGRVVGLDILNQKIKILFSDDSTEIFAVDEIKIDEKKEKK